MRIWEAHWFTPNRQITDEEEAVNLRRGEESSEQAQYASLFLLTGAPVYYYLRHSGAPAIGPVLVSIARLLQAKGNGE